MDGLNALPHGIRELKLAPLEGESPVGHGYFWGIGLILLILPCSLAYYFWRLSRSRRDSELSRTIKAISELATDDPGFAQKVSKLLKLGLYLGYQLDLRASSSHDFHDVMNEWQLRMQTIKDDHSLTSKTDKSRRLGYFLGQLNRVSGERLAFLWRQKRTDVGAPGLSRMALSSGEMTACVKRLEEELFAGKVLDTKDKELIKLEVLKWIEGVP